SAVAVAVHVLQRGDGTGQAGRNVRVQRGVRVLVDLLGDRGTVDEVGSGLADGEGLLRVGLRRGRSVRHRVEVEDDVADLTTGAVDDLHVLVGAEAGDVRSGEAPVRNVDVALLDVELHVRRVGVVLDVHLVGRR